jgi:hypothetical protein
VHSNAKRHDAKKEYGGAAREGTMANLRLQLAIHERPVTAGSADTTDVLTRQIWRGGAMDRTTRTMVADPPRWLSLVETAGPKSALTEDEALLSWDLAQINPGDMCSPEDAGGVILTAMDVDPAVEDEFNDWYNTEHIPILSKLPGMLAARRFRADRGTTRYLALYHVTDPAIYAKPSWYTANETPWMLRMRRFQHNRTYFMFRSPEGAAQ